MLTPKTNSPTCKPEVVSRVMDGTVFIVCSTSWVSRCSLVAISAIFFWSDRKAERRVKKRSRGDFKWRFTSGKTKKYGTGESETNQLGITQPVEREKLFKEFGVSGQSGECRWTKRSWNRNREICANRYKIRSRIFLKWVDKKMLWQHRVSCAWSNSKNKVIRENFFTPLAQGNLFRVQLQERSFKTWGTRTISTWRRSSSTYKRNWELQQVTQLSQWKHQ